MSGRVSFQISESDAALIRDIVTRAQAIERRNRTGRQTLIMDLTACHANGCPLRLQDLKNAPDFDFTHDVWGIQRHIDRSTGILGDCFLPRFAVTAEGGAHTRGRIEKLLADIEKVRTKAAAALKGHDSPDDGQHPDIDRDAWYALVAIKGRIATARKQARLADAAPELLKACKALVSIYEKVGGPLRVDSSVIQAHHAIDRVEGREP